MKRVREIYRNCVWESLGAWREEDRSCLDIKKCVHGEMIIGPESYA